MQSFLIAYPSVALTLPLVLALAALWFAVPSDRKRLEWLLVATTLAVPLSAVAEAIANALSRVRPMKYDLFVYRMDALFGEPSFALGRIVAHHAGLAALVSVTYGLLPMVILGVFALHLYLREDALRVIRAFMVNLMAAVPLYLLIPVCGPAFAFPHFPQSPGAVSPHLLAIHAAPNGVPSVHTSSALLILWFLWEWKWGRVFGVAFLALTMLATMGSGQHYFFDLLCAIPYVATVAYFARITLRRQQPSRSAVPVAAD